MGESTLVTVLTALVGSIGGAATTGWISRLLIKKFITDNDARHTKTEDVLETVAEQLQQIKIELAVIGTTLGQIAGLKEQVQKDHDTIIEIKTWGDKQKNDLNAQFDKIRLIERRFEEMSSLISSLLRSASNE